MSRGSFILRAFFFAPLAPTNYPLFLDLTEMPRGLTNLFETGFQNLALPKNRQ